MRSAASCSRCSRSASSIGLVSRLVAQHAHAVGDLAVLVGDAFEELGALEQVAEAVGLEHDGQRVGRVGLVDLDQPRGEHLARAWPARCAAARAGRAPPRAVADLEQLRLLAVEARLDVVEPRLGGRDLALHGVDAGVEAARSSVREHALLRLVLLDLLALLLDALRSGADSPGQRQHEVGDEGQRDWEPESSSSYCERSAGTGFPRVYLGYAGDFSARDGAHCSTGRRRQAGFLPLQERAHAAHYTLCAHGSRRRRSSPATPAFRPGCSLTLFLLGLLYVALRRGAARGGRRRSSLMVVVIGALSLGAAVLLGQAGAAAMGAKEVSPRRRRACTR